MMKKKKDEKSEWVTDLPKLTLYWAIYPVLILQVMVTTLTMTYWSMCYFLHHNSHSVKVVGSMSRFWVDSLLSNLGNMCGEDKWSWIDTWYWYWSNNHYKLKKGCNKKVRNAVSTVSSPCKHFLNNAGEYPSTVQQIISFSRIRRM